MIIQFMELYNIFYVNNIFPENYRNQMTEIIYYTIYQVNLYM